MSVRWEEPPSVDVTAASTEKSTSAYVALPAEEELAVEVTPPSTEKQPAGEVMPSAEKNISGEIWSAEPPLAPIGWPSCRYIRKSTRMVMNRNHPISCVLAVPDDPDGAVLLLVLMSLLYALLTPWLLWRVAGQPTAFVWTTSLVACSYFLIGTICLSSDTLSTFFRISCAALLAFSATHLIGSINGAAIYTMFTFYAAGMMGYAIGEYLQRVGFETSAHIVATRPFRGKEHQKRKEEWLCYTCFIQGTISLCLLVRMVWVFFPGTTSEVDDDMDKPLFVVQELALEMLLLSFMWSSFVALALLEEALVSVDTMFYEFLVGFVATMSLNIVFLIAKWNAAALLVLWAISIAMVGFFGYCLAVHTHCKHIRKSLRKDGANDEHAKKPTYYATGCGRYLFNLDLVGVDERGQLRTRTGQRRGGW